MKIFNKKIGILTIFLALIALPVNVSYADNSKKPESKKQVGVSKWISPNEKAKKITVVQAGRSLPIRFTLIVGGQTLTSTEAVKVNLEEKTNCTIGENSASSRILVNPEIAIASPSASSNNDEESNRNLTVENGVFKYNWKVEKSLKAGCYVLTAEKGALKISSPLIRIRTFK